MPASSSASVPRAPAAPRPSPWADASLSAAVAGFIAVLVGLTSSIALVFQAAQAMGATPAQTGSWIWAIGLGTGLTSLGLSLWYRQPVLTAWSTPGAALLAATHGLALPEAIGAFVVSALLITAVGVTGLFARVMDRLPVAIAAALLAGVLARFGLDAVLTLRTDAPLVLSMTAAFLLGRRGCPRWAVPGVLATGLAVAALGGQLHAGGLQLAWTTPVWTAPQFSWHAALGVGLPLFIVTMASQNLPGVAALRSAGYDTPVSPVVTATGAVTTLLAPFGAFGINLAAITAAICMGPESHADPRRRYMAAVFAGFVYLAVGVAGGTVAGLLATVPKALVVAVAGLALVGTITGALATALADPRHRDAAGLTFLVTLSGVSLAGVGAAFWGVVAGTAALLVQHWRRPEPSP